MLHSRLYKLAGNAVSVPVVERIVKKILPLLKKQYDTTNTYYKINNNNNNNIKY